MRGSVFISYSRQDVETVKVFASHLALQGFTLWIDEKELNSGEEYTTRILEAIHNSDIYLIFLSKASIQSNWVKSELDFALHEKITRKEFSIIPIKIEDIELPVVLSNIHVIDARFSVQKAAEEFSEGQHIRQNNSIKDITVSSIAFSISEETAVEIGPFNESFTTDDLVDDRERIKKELRKKAYGILMNFVPPDDFDFQSEIPKFTNGLYEESVSKREGGTIGSIGECITVDALVFNPSMVKVNRLLKERLEILKINTITFGLVFPTKENESMLDIGKKGFQKIQDDYVILSYDSTEGATIEIDEDFYLSLAVSKELMKVKLKTKYNFQFERKMRDFSVFDFVRKIIA